ncbi:MAG: XTP/dITP diphosphatase [Desulfuromonadales bacterium]|nr:XTP/dITP diphosphatase [Desulfuromonadales bacterium]NIR34321.1 XTP/dITP diphosphatase [Desulfuromonadales bacterium]NIS41755.1 XTP/dITP diphosphatase [Desulfuromonadales bacterium]
MKLLIATGNKGKLREIRQLLDDSDVEVLGLENFPDLPEVVEDGETFSANARKKAATVARLTGCLTLADDSGLVVEALGGAPGVRSARYAGEDATDADNNRKLLEALAEVPPERRQGAFCCVMALCMPDGGCQLFSGRLEGIIAATPRGTGGFGYDPLFLIPDYDRSLAELPLETKNRISHRGQALKGVVDYLKHLS